MKQQDREIRPAIDLNQVEKSHDRSKNSSCDESATTSKANNESKEIKYPQIKDV